MRRDTPKPKVRVGGRQSWQPYPPTDVSVLNSVHSLKKIKKEGGVVPTSKLTNAKIQIFQAQRFALSV